jgi:aminoglycoside 3-N-acetyltransferase
MSVLSRIPREYKAALKARLRQAQGRFVQAFLSYDASRLLDSLRALGVRCGDSVMLHSAFGPQYGFRGTIEQLTAVFLDAVGPEGNLLMVSLPYRSSSLEYLSKTRTFDVRKTPSMMGLVSEYFRQRPDVVRSLHPTHPVLAWGAKAEWLVAGHEACRYPCGPGSPFEKLEQLDGKVVFYNVPFATFTFFHYLEHLVNPDMPFPLYTEEPFTVPVVDSKGEPSTVTTFVFSREAIRRRRFPVLEAELRRRRLIHERRIGSSRLAMIRVREAIACVREMFRRGQYFYDLSDPPNSMGRTSNAGLGG